MHWIKSNLKFLGAALAVVILGSVAVVVLTNQLSDKRAERDDAIASIEQMRSQKISPSAQNVKIFSEANANLAQALAPFEKRLSESQVKADQTEGIKFQINLRTARDRLVAESTANKRKVKLPENFTFGFGKFFSSLPQPEATPLLTKQLEIIQDLVMRLYTARISSLSRIARLPVEDAASLASDKKNADESSELLPPQPAQAPDSPYASFPFLFIFECSDESLRAFVNSVSNAGSSGKTEGGTLPHPVYYNIRHLQIVNNRAKPPTVQDLRNQSQQSLAPATDESGEAASQSAPTSSGSVAPILIVGNEQVEVTARIDYIEWKGDFPTAAAPDKKSSKKDPKKSKK